MDWLSLLLPVSYLTILLLSLGTFSHLYRRRKALRSAALTPWFPPHLTRQIYLTLLEQASSPSTGTSEKEKAPKIPDSILRAALFRRATEDIHRLISLRSQKPALQQLLQRGAVGDELFQRFERAEKEIETELRDVVAEANALSAPGTGGQGQPPSWGQTIFQSAGECAHGDMLRAKLREVEAERDGERAEWERRRGEMRQGLLADLELGEGEGEGAKMKDVPARKQASSDGSSDAVLVENGGPESSISEAQAQQQNGGGSSKKKKGKK